MMRDKTVKMIITDLDRTLLRSDKSISDYTAEIFKRCRDRGIKVIFATARPIWLTEEYCREICPDAVIAINGTAVYSGGTLLREQIIDAETSGRLIAELLGSGVISRMSAQSSDKYYTSDISKSSIKSYPDNVIQIDFSRDKLPPPRIVSVHSGNIERAAEIVGRYDTVRAHQTSGEDLLDIIPAGAGKWNAVRYIAGYFNIELSDAVAFGDDYNDIEMLKYCGVGVAVENALDTAKAAADFVCGSNDNDGVARWIDENVLQN